MFGKGFFHASDVMNIVDDTHRADAHQHGENGCRNDVGVLGEP